MIFQFDLVKTLDNMDENIYVFHDPEKYDRAILNHPFYKEMIKGIKKEILNSGFENSRILEIGAGPGPLTQYLIELSYKDYFVIEPDKNEFKYLKQKFKSKINDNFKVFNTTINKFDQNGKFDYIVASFVDHHIQPNKKENYYSKIIKLLSDNGIFISGEELLGKYSNEDERINRLFSYHGYIIKTCIEESHFEMAEIETRALKNGIEKWDEYKISYSQYKKILKKCNFNIIKFNKLGPNEVEEGGIYLMVSKKKEK
jgi:SAM-dependent methyltransferase